MKTDRHIRSWNSLLKGSLEKFIDFKVLTPTSSWGGDAEILLLWALSVTTPRVGTSSRWQAP